MDSQTYLNQTLDDIREAFARRRRAMKGGESSQPVNDTPEQQKAVKNDVVMADGWFMTRTIIRTLEGLKESTITRYDDPGLFLSELKQACENVKLSSAQWEKLEAEVRSIVKR